MKIIISNAVTLNGGDFAILDSLMKVVRTTYGDNVEFVVYDSNPDIAKKYYPEINYRKLLYTAHRRKGKSIFDKIWNRTYTKRFLTAARYKAAGNEVIPSLLLSKAEKKDLEVYASADMVITSGGTYLVENYPMHSRIFDFKVTHALKKPLVFFTQSLGPYKRPYFRQTLPPIFNAAKLVLLRDTASLENLKDIGVDVARSRVCADVVFADADPAALTRAARETMRPAPKVAISVREWTHYINMTPEQGMENYKKSIVAICEYICSSLGGEVTFISTCQGVPEYRDDSLTAIKIIDMLSPETKAKCSVDGSFNTPHQLKEKIKNLDLVVSTRMHFAIQSVSVGVPVIPIAYEFKTRELFRKLIPEDLILDTDTINPEKAVQVVKSFYEQLPSFRAQLFEKVEAERRSAVQAGEHLKNLVHAG